MGQYVRGVSIRVRGQQQPIATGLSGDDEGNHVTLQLDNASVVVSNQQYDIDFGGGDVRTMTCVSVDSGAVATFR